MPNNNGIITAPVGIGSVQQAIGSSAKDVKSLCTYSGINKYSKYKPISHSGIIPLSENDYLAYNYGITINSYSNLFAAMHALADGTAFVYQAANIGRLSDFRNYNHHAVEKWFDFIPLTTSLGQTDKLRMRFYGYNAISDLQSLFSWGFLQGYTTSSGNIQLGLVVVPNSITTSSTDMFYIQLTDATTTIADLSDETMFYSQLNTNIPIGTYTAYPVLTTTPANTYIKNNINEILREDATSYTWWVIPYGNYQQFNITSGSGSGTYNLNIYPNVTFTTDANGYVITAVAADIASTYAQSLELSISASINTQGSQDPYSYNTTATIDANGELNVNLNNDKQLPYTSYDNTLMNSAITITITYTFAGSQITKEKTVLFSDM